MSKLTPGLITAVKATHARPAVLRYRGSVYIVDKCHGEAHRNPHIDNCGLCAPLWGITARKLTADTADAVERLTREGVPLADALESVLNPEPADS